MIEVIANEGGDDTMMDQGEIVLSQLKVLGIFCLHNLTSFHSGNSVMDCQIDKSNRTSVPWDAELLL